MNDEYRNDSEEQAGNYPSVFNPQHYFHAAVHNHHHYGWILHRQLCGRRCAGSHQSGPADPVFLPGRWAVYWCRRLRALRAASGITGKPESIRGFLSVCRNGFCRLRGHFPCCISSVPNHPSDFTGKWRPHPLFHTVLPGYAAKLSADGGRNRIGNVHPHGWKTADMYACQCWELHSECIVGLCAGGAICHGGPGKRLCFPGGTAPVGNRSVGLLL